MNKVSAPLGLKSGFLEENLQTAQDYEGPHGGKANEATAELPFV
jgi:hypothetical protein